MIAFVFRVLNDHANQYLASQLPEGIEPVFRTDLNPGEWYNAFTQADFILGNPRVIGLPGFQANFSSGSFLQPVLVNMKDWKCRFQLPIWAISLPGPVPKPL
ncbi:hypothetical protein [Paraflavitalea speifideaquila]|uniref:hypothetical protein n=1 Tax=Paraflavitalea speifideaquila TaxID=3076558 RepID=UPI0028F08A52|nr:hypothetical protein [Paraflavitalea speifideiaquila]